MTCIQDELAQKVFDGVAGYDAARMAVALASVGGRYNLIVVE